MQKVASAWLRSRLETGHGVTRTTWERQIDAAESWNTEMIEVRGAEECRPLKVLELGFP